MRLYLTDSSKRDYKRLPRTIQKILDKQLLILVQDIKHPSLRVKKMKGHEYIWEGSITKKFRFTFQIEGSVCIIRRVGTHDILENP